MLKVLTLRVLCQSHFDILNENCQKYVKNNDKKKKDQKIKQMKFRKNIAKIISNDEI